MDDHWYEQVVKYPSIGCLPDDHWYEQVAQHPSIGCLPDEHRGWAIPVIFSDTDTSILGWISAILILVSLAVPQRYRY